MLERITSGVRRQVVVAAIMLAVAGAFGGGTIHAQGGEGDDMDCMRLCLVIGGFPICLEFVYVLIADTASLG